MLATFLDFGDRYPEAKLVFVTNDNQFFFLATRLKELAPNENSIVSLFPPSIVERVEIKTPREM